MTRLKIALMAGGDSPEREIALQSAALIEAALDHSKYDMMYASWFKEEETEK